MSKDPFTNDDDIQEGERCRVTWEGALLVAMEQRTDHETFNIQGAWHSVAGARTTSLTVHNPERVWIQSIDPEKVRDRITGPFINADAVLLQGELDRAAIEITRLRVQATDMEANYEASKALWKKANRRNPDLSAVSLRHIADAIANPPEPDPLDWD